MYRGLRVILPGKHWQLRLNDLHPDDDHQKCTDDQDNELQKSLEDSVGETAFSS